MGAIIFQWIELTPLSEKLPKTTSQTQMETSGTGHSLTADTTDDE